LLLLPEVRGVVLLPGLCEEGHHRRYTEALFQLFDCQDFAKKDAIGVCAGGERHKQATSTEYTLID
jgi:hypothetical protein